MFYMKKIAKHVKRRVTVLSCLRNCLLYTSKDAILLMKIVIDNSVNIDDDDAKKPCPLVASELVDELYRCVIVDERVKSLQSNNYSDDYLISKSQQILKHPLFSKKPVVYEDWTMPEDWITSTPFGTTETFNPIYDFKLLLINSDTQV